MPEVLRLLARTNCKECGLPTCVAFAVQVAAGKRALGDCPYVATEDRDRFADLQPVEDARLSDDAEEQAAQEALRQALLERFSAVDFGPVAGRLGAKVVGEHLAVHCLGRIFELDRSGNLASECHVNPWVHVPLLDYVIRGVPQPLTGTWVTIGELPAARDWTRFYTYRCDRVLRTTADRDPDLFLDLLDLFGARPLPEARRPDSPFSEEAVVLTPLPRVPLLISYWRPEEGFESQLTTFVDAATNANLGGDALFQLGTGLAEMIRKFFVRLGLG